LPVFADVAEGFYRLVDAAHERKSLAVTSNLHPRALARSLRTLAAATVDRLLHHAHVVTCGDSHRFFEAASGNGVVVPH